MQAHTPLVMSDHILAGLALVTLMAEFTADNQQYSFQTYKQSRVINKNEWIGARIQWTPEDAKRGFATRGLWAWSRHPNFLCEQTFWVRSPRLPPAKCHTYSSVGPSLACPAFCPRSSIIPVTAFHTLPISSTGTCDHAMLAFLLLDAIYGVNFIGKI